MNNDPDLSGVHESGGSSEHFRAQGFIHQPPNPGMRYVYSNCSCSNCFCGQGSSCAGNAALIGLLLIITGYITNVGPIAIGGICVLALAALMSNGDRPDYDV